MAGIQIAGNTVGNVAEVDGTTFRALRTTARPVDYGSYGAYQVCLTSGTIAAGLAAGTGTVGHVFAFRNSSASVLAVLFYLRLKFQCLTLFTAATQTDFGFDAFVLRSYSASHSGQTAATLTGDSMKCRTSMATTSIADIRIANTAELTAGTHTFDGNAFAGSLGDSQRMNPAGGTEEQRVNDPTLEWAPNVAGGESPLIFAQNEGFAIRNRTVWPAAGTGIIQVEARWAEVPAY